MALTKLRQRDEWRQLVVSSAPNGGRDFSLVTCFSFEDFPLPHKKTTKQILFCRFDCYGPPLRLMIVLYHRSADSGPNRWIHRREPGEIPGESIPSPKSQSVTSQVSTPDRHFGEEIPCMYRVSVASRILKKKNRRGQKTGWSRSTGKTADIGFFGSIKRICSHGLAE